MKKVWILSWHLINWETGDNENCWWLYDSKEKARKAFETELQAFYDEYGKRKPKDFTYYKVSNQMATLEIDEKINFWLLFQEEQVM